jgi:hypothetical protein
MSPIWPTIELNRRKSAERQRRLAGQIDNGPMLIVVMRFLIEELRNHQAQNARDIDGKARQLTKGCQLYGRPYRRAARIALGIRFDNARESYRLPKNYRQRLINAGVRPANEEKFEQLNSQLIIDEEILAFAKENPVLEGVKQLLIKGPAANSTEFPHGSSPITRYTEAVNPFNPSDMSVDAQEERERQKRAWLYQLGIELD